MRQSYLEAYLTFKFKGASIKKLEIDQDLSETSIEAATSSLSSDYSVHLHVPVSHAIVAIALTPPSKWRYITVDSHLTDDEWYLQGTDKDELNTSIIFSKGA